VWCFALKGEHKCSLFQNMMWRGILGHEREGEKELERIALWGT
jgi:hypothetical protein